MRPFFLLLCALPAAAATYSNPQIPAPVPQPPPPPAPAPQPPPPPPVAQPPDDYGSYGSPDDYDNPCSDEIYDGLEATPVEAKYTTIYYTLEYGPGRIAQDRKADGSDSLVLYNITILGIISQESADLGTLTDLETAAANTSFHDFVNTYANPQFFDPIVFNPEFIPAELKTHEIKNLNSSHTSIPAPNAVPSFAPPEILGLPLISASPSVVPPTLPNTPACDEDSAPRGLDKCRTCYFQLCYNFQITINSFLFDTHPIIFPPTVCRPTRSPTPYPGRALQVTPPFPLTPSSPRLSHSFLLTNVFSLAPRLPRSFLLTLPSPPTPSFFPSLLPPHPAHTRSAHITRKSSKARQKRPKSPSSPSQSSSALPSSHSSSSSSSQAPSSPEKLTSSSSPPTSPSPPKIPSARLPPRLPRPPLAPSLSSPFH